MEAASQGPDDEKLDAILMCLQEQGSHRLRDQWKQDLKQELQPMAEEIRSLAAQMSELMRSQSMHSQHWM